MYKKFEQLRQLKTTRDYSEKRCNRLIEIAGGDLSTLTLARMNIITAIKCHQSLDEVRMNKPPVWEEPELLDYDPMWMPAELGEGENVSRTWMDS